MAISWIAENSRELTTIDAARESPTRRRVRNRKVLPGFAAKPCDSGYFAAPIVDGTSDTCPKITGDLILSTICTGTVRKLAQNRSISFRPIRASNRQPARFSSRDSVGCEASPSAASGARSQAIFIAGSWRSASMSSQASYPRAIAIIRARSIAA